MATALYAFAAAAEIVIGLLFWVWRPGNAVGPVLLVYLNLIAIPEEAWGVFPHSAFVSAVIELLQLTFMGVCVWMVFRFGRGGSGAEPRPGRGGDAL